MNYSLSLRFFWPTADEKLSQVARIRRSLVLGAL